MFKTILGLGVLCLASSAIPAARAQSAATVYTYVADYGLPRSVWSEFTERYHKTIVPLLDKLIADGTLVEYGASATVIHREGAPTHTIWWCSHTIAGTQKALAELLKLAPPPPTPGVTHRDHLLRSVEYNMGPAGARGEYTDLDVEVVKQGKVEQWHMLYEKYSKPVLQKALADGIISGFGVDQEYVHTEKMGTRFMWIVYPSADSIDRLNAAFAAARGGAKEEERRAAISAYSEVYEPGTHMDSLDHVIAWKHK